MNSIEIVCLANSTKLGGTCVGGVEQVGEELRWVRPVSREPGGQLSLGQRRLDDGRDPQLLDVIQIPVEEICPTEVQPENVYIGSGQSRFIEHLQYDDARSLLDAISRNNTELFGDGERYIEAEYLRVNPAEHSLTLVSPEEVHWSEGLSSYGKRQLRGSFSLGGNFYDLPMKDPAFRPEPESRERSPYLTISLGEEFVETGRCYKIIAGVITL